MYVVVVARCKSGKPNKIYQGRNILMVLAKIRSEHAKQRAKRMPVPIERRRVLVGWNSAMDRYLLDNYRNYTRSQIAAKMSEVYERKITKGSVMTRCRVLGICKKRRDA